MSTWPKPGRTLALPERTTRTGGYLSVGGSRAARFVPGPGALARRRWLITASKFVLPLVALVLLSSIALWPEFDRAREKARVVMNGVRAAVEGARVTDAHYNGLDERGRPFTVTAATAIQQNEDRVDLTTPNADMTLESGNWIDVHAKRGVYMRKDQQLDLSRDVVLYRDDGTTMTTSSASVDMKNGAASGSDPTHVEGPFGTLNAAGFILLDKGAAIQFPGPVHVLLNGVSK